MAGNKPKVRQRPYPIATADKAAATQVVPVTRDHKVTLRAAKKKRDDETRQAGLRTLEDNLLDRSMSTIELALDFARMPVGLTEDQIPQDLIDEYGDQALRAFRTIQAAQLPTKDAPAGLLIAQKVAANIMKNRSAEKANVNPLNIAIQVVQSGPQFEEMDID